MRPPRWITQRDKGRTAVVDLRRKASTTGHLLQSLLVHHLGYDLDDVIAVEVDAPGIVKVITPAVGADGRRFVDVWGDIATDTHRHDVIWPWDTSSGPPSGVATAPSSRVEREVMPGGSTEGRARRVPDAPDPLPGGHGPGSTDHQ